MYLLLLGVLFVYLLPCVLYSAIETQFSYSRSLKQFFTALSFSLLVFGFIISFTASMLAGILIFIYIFGTIINGV